MVLAVFETTKNQPKNYTRQTETTTLRKQRQRRKGDTHEQIRDRQNQTQYEKNTRNSYGQMLKGEETTG